MNNYLKYNISKKIRFITFTLLICICTYNVSIEYHRNYYKKQLIKNISYTIPTVVQDCIDEWVNKVKDEGLWTDVYQKRLDNIQWVMLRGNYIYDDIQINNTSLGTTYFKFDEDGVNYIPYKIVLNDKILFELYGTKYVVYHELGHAILLLDDIVPATVEHDYQIMWFQGLVTYEKFSNPNFMNRMLLRQIYSNDKEVLNNQKTHDPNCPANNK